VGLTDAELAERIREDRIDVLIDLAGHTASNRLLTFAERPAPVQVTWLGYGATTGMTEMDYRLTDAVVDPAEEAGKFFSENLSRLPHAFFCYTPPAEAPEVAALPALANGHVTFGSFNNPSKTGPKVVEVWARVLREIPGSRLLMKHSQLGDDRLCDKFRKEFAAHDIAGERVELKPKIPAVSGHLAAYGRVDIAFDSFPYNGGTTSLEAAWMGVPVIALRGDRLVSRMGASILTQLGLVDLVAEGSDAYVETATALATDLDRLAALRCELRPRMAASPLCDSQTFAREVEAAYREMWRRWCSEGRGHA
jgi:predicted O-linked N-acetylglucosamine transferase (SPINDLY family)